MTGGRILVTVVIQTNVAVTKTAMVPVITVVVGATNFSVHGLAQTIAVAIPLATVAATPVILVAMR